MSAIYGAGALGVVLTPSLLIKLGPMRGSLTHPNPMVQRTTHLEVNVLRALCLACGDAHHQYRQIRRQDGDGRISLKTGKA